jgi:hypothetical protein
VLFEAIERNRRRKVNGPEAELFTSPGYPPAISRRNGVDVRKSG